MFLVRQIISEIFLISTAFAQFDQPAVEKQYKLSVITFITITGYEPSVGQCCQLADNMVINHVNSRRDILPDYHINTSIYDEGKAGISGPRAIMKHVLNFKTTPNDTYLSPLTIGPAAGCNFESLMMRQLQMAIMSSGCSAALFAEKRKLYSNVFQARVTSDTVYPAAVLFFKQIGKWSQIGMILSLANSNDLSGAMTIQRLLTANGIEIVYFDGAPDFSVPMLAAAKQSRARIFMMYSSISSSLANGLCAAYNVTMRSPYYVFLSTFAAQLAGDNPYPFCPNGMLQEQLKILFYYGSTTNPYVKIGPTSFGYNVTVFDDAFNRAMGPKRCFDYEQRYPCHDTAMAALLTLNSSETILRQRYNMSLRDFEKHPDIVGSVVIEAARALDAMGLRIGHMSYSPAPRYTLDEEDILVGQRYGVGSPFRISYKLAKKNPKSMDLTNVTNYYLTQISSIAPNITWFTKTGKPPKDLSSLNTQWSTYPFETLVIVVVISCACIIFQLGCGLVTLGKSGEQDDYLTNFFDVSNNLVLLVGCIALNVWASLLVIGTLYSKDSLCAWRPILGMVGVSAVNGVVCMRMFTMIPFLRSYNKGMTSSESNGRISQIGVTLFPNAPGNKNDGNKSKKPKSKKRKEKEPVEIKVTTPETIQRIIRFGYLIVVSVSIILLAIWLGDMETPGIVVYKSPVVFDESIDSYKETIFDYCYSAYQIPFVMVEVALHIFLLFGACFFAYEARRIVPPPRFELDLKVTRLAVINATTLFIAAVAIVFIIPPAQMHLQLTVLAFCTIVYSTGSTAIVFFPVWARKWPASQLPPRNSMHSSMGMILHEPLQNKNSLNFQPQRNGSSLSFHGHDQRRFSLTPL